MEVIQGKANFSKGQSRYLEKKQIRAASGLFHVSALFTNNIFDEG